MMRQCTYCSLDHKIYYLLKTDNTKAMFMLCSKAKGRDDVFILWLPKEDDLNIPTYISGTPEYDRLKAELPTDKEFTEEDRKVISKWRRAKLTLYNMTKYQLSIIRRYVGGDIKW